MSLLRWIKRLVLFLLLVAAVVLFGGPPFLSSDYGREKVEVALSKGLARDVSIGGLDVGFLFATLDASDVRMGNPAGFPEGDTVAVRSMRIECGLRDLFDGLVKGRVVGEGVDLTILKKGGRTTLDGLGGKGGGEKPEGKRPPLDLEVVLNDCDFTYRDLDTNEATSFEGIGVEAKLNDRQDASEGRVRVTMRELRRDPVVVRDLELDLHADGTVVVLDQARGTMAGGGTLSAQGELALDEAAQWKAKIDAGDVSIDGSLVPVVATFWPFAAAAGGKLEGVVNAGFDFTGRGVTWDAIRPTLSGTGDIRLAQLNLPQESVLAQVAQFVRRGEPAAVSMNDAGAEFRVAGGWVEFNRLSASGGERRYDLAGRVSLEGRLALRLDLMPLVKHLHDDTYKEIAKYTKELPVDVRGSTTEPKLAFPDLKALIAKAAQEQLTEKGKKELEDRLKKALGGGR